MHNCDFCRELSGQQNTHFRNVYQSIAETRVISETANFVALPTVGQIFRGSLLILPRMHIETCAQIDPALRIEFSEFQDAIFRLTRQFGNPVFFEHGAAAHTGGSCGIYHAHLHVVPLPEPIAPGLLFPEYLNSTTTLTQALETLHECDHYLLIGNQDVTVFAEVAQLQTPPASQHFRRIISQNFRSDRNWDWRETRKPEADLLSTIAAYKE